MAHGYYLLTGKPAGVMVHVNVGLANSVMGVVNAASDNIPVVMCSGAARPSRNTAASAAATTPFTGAREMRDQAAMIREVVKWDYELRYPEQAALVVDRAVNISMSEPRGPVYLSLPREVLAESAPGTNRRAAPDVAPTTYAAAAPRRDRTRGRTDREGRTAGRRHPEPRSSRGLRRTARNGPNATPCPSWEYWATRQSLPTTHPMHGGRDPMPWVRESRRHFGHQFHGAVDRRSRHLCRMAAR